jgi:hypothetical protein
MKSIGGIMRKVFFVLVCAVSAWALSGCNNKAAEVSGAAGTALPKTAQTAGGRYAGSGKSFGPLTKPVAIRFASTATASDFADVGTIVSFLNRKDLLPAGSTVTQETISGGAAGSGYLIEAGMADITRSQNALAATRGYNGRPPYKEICALFAAGGNSIALQVLAPDFVKKTGYTSIEQIIEDKYPATLCTEDIGSSDYTVVTFLLEIFGLTMDDYRAWGGKIIHTDNSTAAEMLQDGSADIMITHTTLTSSVITELIMTTPVTLNGFSDKLIKGMVERGYAPRDIPAGHFGQFPNGGKTAFGGNSVIVSKNMTTEVAYNITKSLLENREEIAEQCATMRIPDFKAATDTAITIVPLHPGAVAYYQDIGVLDADGKYIGEPAGR